jgi:hypothetical protein
MATTTNFGWETPDDTDLVKDGAAAIRTALGGVDTSFVDLKGGTTGQVLAKNSNTDLDFIWTADASGIPASAFTAKGALLVGTGTSTYTAQTVGSNGQVLTANSAQADGVEWTTPSSGGEVLISETTASAISSLSLSSIPGTYKHLRLDWTGIQHSATGSQFDGRINNDSGANYSLASLAYYNSAWNLGSADNYTSVANFESDAAIFGSSCTSTTNSNLAQGSLTILNYASTSRWKQFFVENSSFRTAGAGIRNPRTFGIYRSLSAVTSIDIFRIAGTATFSNVSNTSIRLYGIY